MIITHWNIAIYYFLVEIELKMAKSNRVNARYLHSKELEDVSDLYREKLVPQFLHHYFKYKDNEVEFKFGDEVSANNNSLF